MRNLLRPVILIAPLLLAACGSAGAARIAPPPAPAYRYVPPSHVIKTVFLIVMENHDWSSIQGNKAAPYINHTLLPRASYATQYYNPPGNHPSLPNYLWLEAGTNCFADTGCITNDGPPKDNSTTSKRHLVTLLGHAHISWRAYEEGISGTSCPLTSSTTLQVGAENGLPGTGASNLYAAKHDPFVYFDNVTGHMNPNSPICIHHIRPLTQLAGDLKHHRTARYSFITPDVCNDMHSSCPFYSDPVKQGDAWLSHVIPGIMASRAYKRGGAIFITWDEGEGGDGPIGMIVLSPDAKGHGYHNAIHYTHSSTLRTIEEIFHVRPFLGGAAHAADLRNLFRRFP